MNIGQAVELAPGLVDHVLQVFEHDVGFVEKNIVVLCVDAAERLVGEIIEDRPDIGERRLRVELDLRAIRQRLGSGGESQQPCEVYVGVGYIQDVKVCIAQCHFSRCTGCRRRDRHVKISEDRVQRIARELSRLRCQCLLYCRQIVDVALHAACALPAFFFCRLP